MGAECKLELHPEETKIVFCPNFIDRKQDGYPESFDFLGFTFRQRSAKGPRGTLFDGFLAGISRTSQKNISARIRHWCIGRSSDLSLERISRMYNPTWRGWVNYYGKFQPQAMSSVHQQWNYVLSKWAQRKYKRFQEHVGWRGDGSIRFVAEIPNCSQSGHSSTRERGLCNRSRMNREVHVRFCERPGVRFPRPTRRARRMGRDSRQHFLIARCGSTRTCRFPAVLVKLQEW